jgi:hypothetical protein
MDDASPGRHPIDRTRLDALDVSHAVAVNHGTLEQVGHCRESDVRVRSNVKVVLGLNINRSEVIKKHKRSDTALLKRWQYATHHHAASKIMQSGHQYLDYWHLPFLTVSSLGMSYHGANNLVISVATSVLSIAMGHFGVTFQISPTGD